MRGTGHHSGGCSTSRVSLDHRSQGRVASRRYPAGLFVVCPGLPPRHSFAYLFGIRISAGRTQKLRLTPRRKTFAVRHRLLESLLARVFTPFMVELFVRRHFCRPPGPGPGSGPARRRVGNSPRQPRLNGQRTPVSTPEPPGRDFLAACVTQLDCRLFPAMNGIHQITRFGSRQPQSPPAVGSRLRFVHVARVQRPIVSSDRTSGLLCCGLRLHLLREPAAAGLLRRASVEPREHLSMYVALRASALGEMVSSATLSPTGEVGFTGRADRLEDVNARMPTSPQTVKENIVACCIRLRCAPFDWAQRERR